MEKVLKIFEAILTRPQYFLLINGLRFVSMLKGTKSLFIKDEILINKSIETDKILLLALFQKGYIRSDIVNLLKVAKQIGFHTIVVNSGKIKDHDRYSDIFDTYIERFNFGRDFGNYKVGLKYSFKNANMDDCSSLILCNDSVFYSQANLKNFLREVLDSEKEALGATENYEITAHLGSFFLCLKNVVFNHKRFKKYWKKYRCTDLRPAVISKGEMGLSLVMKKCVSNPEKYGALYSTAYVSKMLRNNKDLIDSLPGYYRQSRYYDTNKPLLKSAYLMFYDTNILRRPLPEEISDVMVSQSADLTKVSYASNIGHLVKTVKNALDDLDPSDELELYEKVRAHVVYDVLETWKFGSQIHQNGPLLHYLGLPLIKLDGLYRGMFDAADLEVLADQLSESEKYYFLELMYARPYAVPHLVGWRKFAYLKGLI